MNWRSSSSIAGAAAAFTALLPVAGAGTDHIQSEIGWTLDVDEENLTLLRATTINGNGNAGGNVIFGNNGNNQLLGLAGNDTVNGGAGDDTLLGGFGKDLNTGSGGLDHIKFNALGESGTTFATRDAINTFAHGDKIDLSAIDANTNVAGNRAFIFSSAQTLERAGDRPAGSDELLPRVGRRQRRPLR
jgi:Ca2+-binding RTX toxin-like protein